MRAPRLVVVTLLLALVTSCAAILGLDPLEPYDGVEPEGGAPIDGDAGPDAPAPSDADGSTVGEAGTLPCSPDEQPAPPVVYVSANAGDGGTPTGSADQPYRTIAAAFPQARLVQAKTIAIDEGTYVENVTLENFANPITIDGAWIRSADGVWRRDCSPDRRTKTVLRSTMDVGLRVQGQAVVGVTVSSMTIEARASASTTPANSTGASRYGVFVDNSLLSLENVRVLAPRGDHGGAAAPGTPGAPKCESSEECVAVPTAGASSPNAAPAPTFGTFGATGFLPANGGAGANGTDGTNGTPGRAGMSRSDCFGGCAPTPSCEQANAPTIVSSTAGRCGCGGSGGTRGEPGRGGGASIALYVVGRDSFVVAKASEFFANPGGNGSAGGQGGAGGQPTAGVAGQSAICFEPKCCRCGDCPDCGCYGGGNWDACCVAPAPASEVLFGGAAGGNGMAGGRGANGGGGAGGPSFVYATVNGASVQLEASKATFHNGGVGAGGAPNGPSGVHP